MFCVRFLREADLVSGWQFPSSQGTRSRKWTSVSLWNWGQESVITVKRGVCDGVSPATFASLLSVILPVHLSVRLKALTNSIYKGNTCHVLSMREGTAQKLARWSALRHYPSASSLVYSVFFFFFKKLTIIIKKKSIFQKPVLPLVVKTDSSITEPLRLSFTLIRISFQMSSQVLFSRTRQKLNI